VRVASAGSVGALASLDVMAAPIMSAPTERIRVVTADLSFILADLTATDDGAEVGLAHGDYTVAEIEECLEAQGAVDQGDKIANERSNRLVRSIGVFTDPPGATGGGSRLNGGLQIKTRLNWVLTTGDVINVWIRNGSLTIYSTGASILCQGNLWIKD